MNESPKISICIPTYNRLDFLKLTIELCLKQTFQDFEIVITDNSDNNNSKNYLTQLNEPKIRYYKNSNNLGFTGNFNAVIKRARGSYIKVLMDDDVMEPNTLAEMAKVLDEHSTVGVVMSPMNVIDQNGKKDYYRAYLIKKVHYLYQYQKHSGLVQRNRILLDFLTKKYPCCVPSALMYRRECFDSLGGLDLSMKFATDVEICMRIAKRYDFFYLNKFLTSWRFSPSSLTVNLHKTGNSVEEFYYLTEKYLDDPEVKSNLNSHKWSQIRKEAYLFATKRCFLAIIAGIQNKNFWLISKTLKLIYEKDPYAKVNLLKVVPNLIEEVITAAKSWLKI